MNTLFKTLLLSLCAVVVMASSYSASAMTSNDDNNNQVPAAPAVNPNAQAAPAVNPETAQAPAAPSVNPKTQAAPAVNPETTQGAGSSTSSRSTNSTTDEAKSQSTNSQVVPPQDVDPELKNTLQFMMGAPDLVIDRMIFQGGLENMGNLYKAVEAGLADIKVSNNALAEKREKYVLEPALEKERAARYAINQETQAQLARVKARLDLAMMNQIENDVIPAFKSKIPEDLSGSMANMTPDESMSFLAKSNAAREAEKVAYRQMREGKQREINEYIDEDMRESAAAGKPVDLFDLWESDELVSYFKVKDYLNLLPENTTDIDISRYSLNLDIFRGVPLRKVPPLNRFTNLKKLELNLSGRVREATARILSVKGLENLPKLKILNIRYYNATNIIGLEKLASLEVLVMDDSNFTSLAQIEKLQNLTDLSLESSKVNSLRGIERLQKLQNLAIVGTNITSLTGLESLPNLKEVYLVTYHGERVGDTKPLKLDAQSEEIIQGLIARGVKVHR